ncbi:MAG: DUF4435 domain-containing protein [Balneolaceae bacterium]
MSTFDKESYKSYVEMSNNSRLLVEGVSDKIALTIAIRKNGINSSIEIDSAEHLIGFDEGIGNREKIETVCEELKTRALNSTFFGLVDREFREFDIGKTLSDNLNTHYNDTYLYWTFGHSIENYLFNIDLIQEALIKSTKSPKSFDAINLLRESFDSVLEIAGAISLNLNEFDFSFSRVSSMIDFTYFDVVEENLTLDIDKYKNELIIRGISEAESNLFIVKFLENLELCKRSDTNHVSLYIHGHIGLNILRSSYAYFLDTILDEKENIHNCFLTISTDYFFHICITEYLNIRIEDRLNFPELILDRY